MAAGFDLSCQDFTVDQQRMFRRLGLHPGHDIDAYARRRSTSPGCPPRVGS